MKTNSKVTREEALKCLETIKEQKIFFPLLKIGAAYMIDEVEFFYYNYSSEQKKCLYTVLFALNNLIMSDSDIDIHEINNNSTNSKQL